MPKQPVIQWHDNGALVWTGRLALTVSAVAVALPAATGLLWATGISPAFQYVFGTAALIGGVALFVAVSGFFTSATTLRYRDVSLPQPSPAHGTITGDAGRRRSTGRRSGGAYFWMALSAGGFALVGLTYWGQARGSPCSRWWSPPAAVPAAIWAARRAVSS